MNNNNEFVMNNSLLILQSFRKQNYYLGKIKYQRMGDAWRTPNGSRARRYPCLP